jgi:soluble P-type ATPase
VAGLDLAKSEKDDTLTRGDASIHLAARNMLSAEGAAGTSTSSSRWLVTTGVGKLLSFVHGRSMQIALLPSPSTPSVPQSDEDVKRTLEEMNTLIKQLPNVKFDLLIADGRRRGQVKEEQNDNTAQDVLANVLSKMDDLEPIRFVVVSDREDYLGAARDLGMYTCRVRPKNRRLGITTNYDVDDIGSVQEVINDINGVSFNSALKC